MSHFGGHLRICVAQGESFKKSVSGKCAGRQFSFDRFCCWVALFFGSTIPLPVWTLSVAKWRKVNKTLLR